MAVQRAGKLCISLGHCVVVVIGICVFTVTICRSYLTFVWQLESVASTASILATARVEQTWIDQAEPQWMNRTVRSRAELVVIRAYPPSVLVPGQRIQLQYERLPEGDSGMNGPNVPPLDSGSIFVVPLKANPKPSSEAWRLIADEGGGTVIPAIEGASSFPNRPSSGRDYLLQEVASALSAGTREELLRETSYLTSQKTNGYASEVMKLLASQVKEDTDRWALVAAALVSPLGMPRPTIADFMKGEYGANGTSWAGSLTEMSIRRLTKPSDGKDKLIRAFLNLSDLAEWGTGIALQEFVQAPSLVAQLNSMLQSRRPGSLYVAYDVMKAGQHIIVTTAMDAAFSYVNSASTRRSDIQAACWTIRDFGTDAQFKEFLSVIRRYQYQNQTKYDELWRNTIWSDNERERAVLEILLDDQRMYDSSQRYSDVARYELARLNAPKSH